MGAKKEVSKKKETRILTSKYIPWFANFLLYLVGRFAKKFNVQWHDPENIKETLPKPYFICANHIGFWDPFMLDFHLRSEVNYVVSDFSYRYFWRRQALKRIGTIPKVKLVADASSVRRMMTVLKEGFPLGIFPEGSRTWDGAPLPIIPNTVKLIRKMRLPVVTPVMKGMFLSNPRWGKNPRFGKIIIEYQVLLKPEDYKSISDEEILKKLEEAISYDEFAWQRENMIPYKGKDPAEHIEYALFMCPTCGAIGDLHSRGDSFKCSSCGAKTKLNEYGFFEPLSEHALQFDNIHDWNLWQLEELSKRIKRSLESGSKEPIFTDKNGILSSGAHLKPLRRVGKFDVSLYNDRIELVNKKDKRNITFSMDQIRAANVQDKEPLEFHVAGLLYQIEYKDFPVSGYKWMTAIRMIQKETGIDPEALI